MPDFTYTSQRITKNPSWRFSIQASLSPERKADAVRVASRIYEKRFGVPAPKPEEQADRDSLCLIFPLPEDSGTSTPPVTPALAGLPLFEANNE